MLGLNLIYRRQHRQYKGEAIDIQIYTYIDIGPRWSMCQSSLRLVSIRITATQQIKGLVFKYIHLFREYINEQNSEFYKSGSVTQNSVPDAGPRCYGRLLLQASPSLFDFMPITEQ